MRIKKWSLCVSLDHKIVESKNHEISTTSIDFSLSFPDISPAWRTGTHLTCESECQQLAMYYLPLSLGESNITEDDLKMQQCHGILSLKKKMHLKMASACIKVVFFMIATKL